LDPFGIGATLLQVNQRFKPLLGKVIYLNAFIIYPFTHLFFALYMALYGRALIRLLDDDRFVDVFTGRHRQLFVSIVAFFVVSLIGLHQSIVLRSLSNSSSALVL